jgi:predicted dehydrogenase
MEKVRFGIIGIGNIGTVHARYLLAVPSKTRA